MKTFLSLVFAIEALFGASALLIRGLLFFGVRVPVSFPVANALVLAAIAVGGGLYILLLLGAAYKQAHRPKSPRPSLFSRQFWSEFFSGLARSPFHYIDILLDDPPIT